MTVQERVAPTGAGVLTNPDGLVLLTRPEAAKKDTITVKIPDLFISIVGKPRELNPFLEKTISTDDWTCKVLRFDENLTREWINMKFPLLCASMVPNSTEQPLQAFTEWISWVFPFDDRVDGGDLADDFNGAAEEIIESLAIMDDDYPTIGPEGNGVRHMFQKIWWRVSKYAPPDERRRYKRLNRYYMLGLLQQIKWLGYKDRILTVDEYLAFRRPCSGVGPTCLFAEWSVTEANKIPCEVVEHPSVEIFRDLVIDIVSIANDIYSCPKDIPNGEGSNIISVLLRQGYSLQGAIDEAAKMVLDRYKIWEQAVRDLPSWGEEIDAVVLKLVQAYSDVCWGNMNWSFVTSRYMGDEKEQARTTGLLTFAVKDIEKMARVPQSP
ncbi:hypothetical protein TWF225_008062 [Orbilia oligospora]|uniref:Terpene synthase n=1 Tax=Orbilia oligospora TaxID=2813651 RepID=A0A7C8K6D5_ORBOL|nr:hypothetical protein TWF751_010573 [Orbilia oligospora]KAF3177785.1 hypothetical protein TWF225_008062 [Orbilia oligospora]KAF3239801.1 hypothetical protein TWF128_011685 [Orbilia oligospora]KAF3247999.1 hypothetical protein TWF217_009457 [Orbilia oligospora]TGJ67031.1 terpene cyclase [Orbilia oligospora]